MKWREEGREEGKGRRMGGKSHDDFGIWSTPSPAMWNWIKETSFKMEPGGQKRELSHTTTSVRDPNMKRPTLHSQQKVSTLPSQQEKERFLLTQQQTQPMGTIASQPTGSHHHPEFLLLPMVFCSKRASQLSCFVYNVMSLSFVCWICL